MHVNPVVEGPVELQVKDPEEVGTIAFLSDPEEMLPALEAPGAADPLDGPEAALPQESAGASAQEVEFQKVFAAVQHALQMASYLPAEQAGITRVAVVSRTGQLIASAALDGPSRARFLLDQLHALGFEERRSTAAIQKLGCDLLLVHAASLQHGQEQGIVRGLNGERWPPEA